MYDGAPPNIQLELSKTLIPPLEESIRGLRIALRLHFVNCLFYLYRVGVQVGRGQEHLCDGGDAFRLICSEELLRTIGMV